MSPELLRLERVAFRSWPAAEVVEEGGVLLRATGGGSHRANSAATHAWRPGLGLEEGLARIEAFYRARARAPEVQVSPLAPPGLDALLAARGYARVAPVLAETAPLEDLVNAPLVGDARAEILAAPDAAWIDVEVTRGRFASIAGAFLAGMHGLGDRAGFGVVRAKGGELAGACLAVVDEGVVFLAAMRVFPELRRRGAARALLHASARWAKTRGASLAFLQVEEDNLAALALYGAAGFVPRYGYHYRSLAGG